MKKTFLKLLTVVIVVCATLFTLTACEKECSHSESDWFVKTQATCIEKGLSQKKCLTCEKVLEEKVLEIASHTESDWIIDDNSTCETGGLKHKECIICDAVLQVETIAKGAHTESDWIVDQNSTCLNSGLKHKECTECKTILESAVIDKLEHTKSDWIVEQNSTCLNSGLKHKECTECKTILESAAIDKLEHTESDWIIDYDSTCQDIGLKHKKCTECETILETDAIEKKHIYADFICKYCGDENYTESLTFSINGEYAYVIGIEDETETEVIIPSKYNGLPVIIEESVFEGNENIKEVVILDGVVSIGSSAFSGCTSLAKIEIPNSVTSIGDSAFSGCTSLAKIEIPDSVTSMASWILNGCKSLTSVVIGAGVASVGIEVFRGCDKLENITVASGNSKYHSENNCVIETATNTLILGWKNSIIPDYVTSIGRLAFWYCTSLVNIEIPNSVTSIGSSAFSNCTSLTNIEIPNSVIEIGAGAFSGCSGLESIIVASGNSKYHSENNCLIETATNTLILGCKNSIIPNYITSIGTSAFSGCSGLTSIEIPDSVTSISSSAFSGCSSLQYNIEGNLKYLGNRVNKYLYLGSTNSTEITSATINAECKIIETSVFYDCIGLENISVASGNKKYHSENNCIIETATNTLIFGCKNSIIPDYVTSIGERAFYNCRSLTSIKIPDSVVSIGAYAFSSCNGLNKIYCEAERRPNGWDYAWNYNCSATVHWGYAGEN